MSTVSLGQGWKFLMRYGIEPLQAYLEHQYHLNIHSIAHNQLQRPIHLQHASRLYSLVYLMAVQPPPHNHCAALYKLIAGVLNVYVEKHIFDPLAMEQDTLLNAFVLRWELFKHFNNTIAVYFKYINRYYVLHNSLEDTHTMGIHLFQSIVEAPLRYKLVQHFSDLFANVRGHFDGENDILSVLERTVKAFVDLGVYGEFEQIFLLKCSQYYETLGDNLIQQQLTVFGFVQKAQAMQSREIQLLTTMLPQDSHPSFVACFHKKCLAKILPALIADKTKLWTQFFSSKENTHYVELLFNLFAQDHTSLSAISSVFEQSIAENGLALVEQQVSAESKDWEPPDYDPHHHQQRDQIKMQFDYVDNLIYLYDLFNHFCVNCFRNHPLFEEALKNGFRRILHKDMGAITNTEILARFCDYVLNESHELLTTIRRADQAVEAYLDKLAALFSYCLDYDLFTFVYRQYLASRLLENRSHSEEAERSMIAKMKIRAGPRFTSRLEGMINDMSISRQINKDFQVSLSNRRLVDFEGASHSKDDIIKWMGNALPTEVKVLTRGIWPPMKGRVLQPPEVFADTALLFQAFFENQKKRKVLNWSWDLGTVSLVMRDRETNDISHVVIASTMQAMVLVLFNDRESLTFQEICKLVGMESWITIRVLHSLCCGRFKILSKSGSSVLLTPSESFRVNEDFSFKDKFIALPFPDLHERSEYDRSSYDCSVPIKAFIVRTMKRERSMRASDIIDRVMNELERFRPELRMIASVLDNLVDNDYIERDGAVADLYHYIP